MSSQNESSWKNRLSRFIMLFIYAWYGQSSANQASPLDMFKLILFCVTAFAQRFLFIFFGSMAYSFLYTILLMLLFIAP